MRNESGEHLLGHPALADAVVVASPDERILRQALAAHRRALMGGVR